MSRTTPRRGQTRGRVAQAALVGIAAGLIGVAVSRALFGPVAAPFGVIIGAAALVAGTLMSWRVHRIRRPADSAGIPRGVNLRRRAHPVAWISPVTGSIITMLAWAGVSHSSGSGWVQTVGALLGAFLLVGLVAPIVPARRAHLECTACPADARAGQPLELTFEVDRPVRIHPRYPAGAEHQAGGHQRGSRTAVLRCTPGRRGILDTVVVEVASSAPFGLVWWARDVEVVLPRVLHVAPRTGEHDRPLASMADAHGEAVARVPSGLGEPRGVRPYTAGDPRRAVHWPATAHAGTLMVRESERQVDDPVVVDLVLPDDPAAAEEEAERMMAAVGNCLARRKPVVLITREAGGRVIRSVADTVDLGRRLARAVPS
ncbi:MAG TPA: DUF58 domain-containing protein [Acidimicrobiales bacterium]